MKKGECYFTGRYIPDSRIDLSGLEAIGGRAYLIPEVAERLKEQCVLK